MSYCRSLELPYFYRLPCRSLHGAWGIFLLCWGVFLQSFDGVQGAIPSERIFPQDTQGWVSCADFAKFEQEWQQTQIGKFFNDPQMKPFLEQAKGQIEGRFTVAEDALGIAPSDLEGISTGEFSLGLVRRGEERASLLMVVDVSGKDAEAKRLVERAEARFAARDGKSTAVDLEGLAATQIMVPATGKKRAVEVYFIHAQGLLCGCDSRATALGVARRIQEKGSLAALGDVAGFEYTMSKCADEAGETSADIRWFVRPFPLVGAWRSLELVDRPFDDRDPFEILPEQGFDGFKGAGGFVHLLLEEGIDWIHRTSVYAPPAPGADNDTLRWTKSMRMCQTPNATDLPCQDWVRADSTDYATVQLSFLDIYDNLQPVFDAFTGYEKAFESTMSGYKDDPFGPKVDIRNELCRLLGPRTTWISHVHRPIQPDSEHSILAIESNDPESLAKTINKFMENDPAARQIEVEGIEVWEIKEEEYDEYDAPIGLEPIGGGGSLGGEDEEKPFLPNSAVCVAKGPWSSLLTSDTSPKCCQTKMLLD